MRFFRIPVCRGTIQNMETGRNMWKHGLCITLIALVVLITCVLCLLLPTVERIAARMIGTTFGQLATQQGLDRFSYDEIRVDVIRQTVEMEGLSLCAGSLDLSVRTCALSISLMELLPRSKGLSGVDVAMESFKLSTADLSVQSESVRLELEGNIPVSRPERFLIEEVLLVIAGGTYGDREKGLSVSVASATLDTEGTIRAATLQQDLGGIMDDLEHLDMTAKQGTLSPDERIMAQLGMFALVSPWIADAGNWRFDSLSIEAVPLPASYRVDSFTIDAPLLEASGHASIPRKGATDISMELSFARLHDQVRTEMYPLIGMFGHTIPPGAFTFEFSWQGTGFPQMLFR